MLETIEADADRVTRLITELLDVSRIDSGRLQVRPLPIDVSAVFAPPRRAGGRQRPASATGSPIEVADELPEVWADPDRLDQILSNLIENAFRHGDGVVTLAAQRTSGGGQELLESKGHSATGVDLLVSDEGKGIAPDHRDLVFSRFWHGSGPREHRAWASTSSRAWSRRTAAGSRSRTAPSGGAQFRLSLPSEPPDYLA